MFRFTYSYLSYLYFIALKSRLHSEAFVIALVLNVYAINHHKIWSQTRLLHTRLLVLMYLVCDIGILYWYMFVTLLKEMFQCEQECLCNKIMGNILAVLWVATAHAYVYKRHFKTRVSVRFLSLSSIHIMNRSCWRCYWFLSRLVGWLFLFLVPD